MRRLILSSGWGNFLLAECIGVSCAECWSSSVRSVKLSPLLSPPAGAVRLELVVVAVSIPESFDTEYSLLLLAFPVSWTLSCCEGGDFSSLTGFGACSVAGPCLVTDLVPAGAGG